jgi:hypothetical protein
MEGYSRSLVGIGSGDCCGKRPTQHPDRLHSWPGEGTDMFHSDEEQTKTNGEYRQAAKRAAADIEGHSEATELSQPG